MPGLNTKVQKFEGWHYDAFAGVVPRRRVYGRDLGKTFSTPIVTFESIDPIPSSHVHFPSATSTTPSISIAAQDSAQYFSSYDVSLISDDSSINDSADLSSASTTFSLPTGPSIPVDGHPEPEKTKPVNMSSPRKRPRRSLTRNFSASTVSSSLKRASKTGGSSKGINTILRSQQLLSEN
ncbi:uncharacterized protein ARMOST_20802 [Armillaria ostoyae]|uniref:Uncharacterized protein n=1 Tax=Armillaria ostoyae TaxID=47428 RepID=A0A284S8F3_ARMOS|nr:uncharacterized protein ARMOST_20802 [Armillaria ostoyae]